MVYSSFASKVGCLFCADAYAVRAKGVGVAGLGWGGVWSTIHQIFPSHTEIWAPWPQRVERGYSREGLWLWPSATVFNDCCLEGTDFAASQCFHVPASPLIMTPILYGD